MKIFRIILAIALLVVLIPCSFVFCEVYFSIKPGMTRADLLMSFEYDGGIRSPGNGCFIYRRFEPSYFCKHFGVIKVDVEFEFDPQRKDHPELPSDKIIRVSMPYLEYRTYD